MTSLRTACLVLSLIATPLWAQGISVPEQAAAARDDLLASIEQLEASDSGRDQVLALSQTIQAYEKGLGALREALRTATIREAALVMRFEAKRERVSQLLGVLSGLGSDPSPSLLLHPSGPLGTARAGLMLSDVTPALQAEVETLRAELQEVRDLRALQAQASQTLQRGLEAAQGARTQLSQAIAARGALPKKFITDPERLLLIIEDADTLDALATGLAPDLTPDDRLLGFEDSMGRLPMPVLGQVLRRSGEADAAGITRPGLVIATRPEALVTAPWSGTIRYIGPFLDYGNVVILEPGAGFLLILSGLGVLYGEVGEVIAAGTPLGLMGSGQDEITDAAEGGNPSGAGGTETLYIELRQGGLPVDPGAWFAETKD